MGSTYLSARLASDALESVAFAAVAAVVAASGRSSLAPTAQHSTRAHTHTRARASHIPTALS